MSSSIHSRIFFWQNKHLSLICLFISHLTLKHGFRQSLQFLEVDELDHSGRFDESLLGLLVVLVLLKGHGVLVNLEEKNRKNTNFPRKELNTRYLRDWIIKCKIVCK